jgi:hypothetical protein
MSFGSSEWVFEAQIEEDTSVAVARARPDRNGKAGHDLQAGREIDRPAHAGRDHQIVGPPCSAFSGYDLVAIV